MPEPAPLDLVLTSLRLRLAPPAPSDAADTAAAMTPAVARRLLSWPSPMSEAEALERIRLCRAEMAAGTALHFVLRMREGGAFVGWTSVWQAEGGDEWQIGFWIAESRQGSGYGGEAASAVTAHLGAARGAHLLCALVQPDNVRSIAILRRLGMDQAGTAACAPRHRKGSEQYLRFVRHG